MKNEFIIILSTNIHYLFSFAIILIILELFPSYNIGTQIYNNIYYQINFSTFHFDFSKFFLYIFSIVLGFTLVNKLYRNKIFQGLNDNFRDIIIVSSYSFVIYFISAESILIGKYDYEGFCSTEGKAIIESHKKDGVFGNSIYTVMVDFQRIYSFKFIQNFLNISDYKTLNSNNCVYPGFVERFLKNYFLFIFPFFIGLNYSSITERVEFFRKQFFCLEWNWNNKTIWPFKQWVYLSFFLFFITLNIIFHFLNYCRDSYGRFLFFIVFSVIILGSIFYYNNKVKLTKKLELNTVVVIMIILPFINIHCVYDLILFGVLNGILVEAICKEGIVNIWKKLDNISENKVKMIEKRNSKIKESIVEVDLDELDSSSRRLSK
jgi:hypothetical protein